ncbi:hypothetical protein A3A09_01830 [Candidatus Nomurabacteria bacterium RIFCSPLOWO2_01_FULL_42_20]|uniref:Ribosomal RNA small subunit methyltransferase I n=1 Tax=Candidatus Nomurabacteria bacterium RIFCSPHIGHO2_01_FULL_42_16 TaxID=1801743 RepID=A0A1F6VLW1_9BACT|nr:MAG: hypothetical protein A2824_01165 [Candidatus Nomurabacteria bacterium RIFCSPHIGHO2_01_FULL_42_16]OGI91360.1 MAG: hypothetical protein A3A09_01830 [Candidatus Nomurabacteria bacterium RIFCSPLOWO2_01_FULL_42_20]
MSKFYVVATPIGNLEDITLRALRVLKEVDLILCEDTRVTKKLLDHYAIKKPLLSYHEHSKLAKIDSILKELKTGKNIALVSDAGTPAISDPGSFLISKIKAKFSKTESPDLSTERFREKFGDDVQIIPIPGPSALITALSASGIPSSEFTFLGFLPHKKGRETLFKEIAEAKRTMVFYESPHRILKTLESLQKFAPNKKVCIARELTKIYEEFKTGTPLELLAYFSLNPDKVRGEFTVLVSS